MKKIFQRIYSVLNRIITRTEWYNEEFWKGTTKFWNIPSCDYNVVNLGSNSGKYAFNYDNLPIKGLNWAIGPQSLVHDFNILKNYFSYMKEGGIVFIPICPFSCLKVTYNKDKNFKYYPILHPATIIDFDDNERTRAYKIRSNPFKAMPMYCIKKTLKEFFTKASAKLKSKAKVDFDKNAEDRIKSWKKQFGITDLSAGLQDKHKNEQTERAALLREMIEFCKERNLRPYIVLPPAHPALSRRLSQAILKNYVYDFIELATNDSSIVLDYFNDSTLQKDAYYQDSFFMNKKGAAIFTKRILNDLDLLKQ